MTPNNPQSSRSHLFISIYIKKHGEISKPSYTIIDMGGSEDVDAIQNMYYTKKKGLNIERLARMIESKKTDIQIQLTRVKASHIDYNSAETLKKFVDKDKYNRSFTYNRTTAPVIIDKILVPEKDLE